MESGFLENTFQTFLYLFNIRKVSQQKTLFGQRKIWFGFFLKKIPFILSRKHFLEVVKNLKISCYLLIISNSVLNLLIAIYFVLNLFFLILTLRI
jgi:hypothetical protein